MSRPIPLSAPDIGDNEIAAVTRVLRSGQLSLGPELVAFESELAALHGVAEAVAISSGTAGLHLALVALGIGPGDEVILPSFTFVAVANAIVQVGARPIFADIDPSTLNLDPHNAKARISPATRALIVVHTFGVPAEMDPLRELAAHHGLALIEDACEALGARYRNAPVGSFGQMAVFGFYPNKQMTTGEGGAILTNSRPLATQLRSLRNQGRDASGDWLDHRQSGYNYRLGEMAATLGRVQLARLPAMLAERAAVAMRYDALLADVADVERPPLTMPAREISWFVYVVRLGAEIDRDLVRATLAGEGIATGRYFPPLHQQPACKPYAQATQLPHTESIGPRVLALPFFNRIAAADQQRVVNALKRAIVAHKRIF